MRKLRSVFTKHVCFSGVKRPTLYFTVLLILNTPVARGTCSVVLYSGFAEDDAAVLDDWAALDEFLFPGRGGLY